ncbi:MAG: branched chain amino acid aminotransferase [Candidatus Marinimicrobia bacterium]|nr:branched chain amino acid aminotransferase [Candidatus Neomarinimicrobiota bacterium]|tara:strand:+ start:2841 stop:3764 length:924 start_codon:yes stop_codon:yes gene_type:complete
MSNYSKHIWFDGKIIPFNEAKIHVMSHCIHYGSGVFEGIKCYDTPKGPAIFRLTEHMERLHQSASSFNIKIPFSIDELNQGSIELIKLNDIKNCYLRPVAFYGFDTLGVHPKNCPVQASIATLDWGAYVSKEALEKGANITISPWRKFQSKSFPASTKATGQYLNSLLAVQDAKSKGFDEALLLNEDDSIAEGSGQNIFVIKDGIFHTNDKESNILMGITRDTLFTLIKDLGFDYKIDKISKEELFNADEVFYCGSASEVTPIRRIDDHIFGNNKAGDITLEIQKLYYETVRGKHPKYESWLTYVNQ